MPISAQKALLILIAEGDASLRRGIEIFFVSEGHYAMSAATIGMASTLLRENDFDLMVSNLDLPDGSGFELLAQARKLQPIKAIAIASASRAAARSAAIACGFSELFILPFDLSLLSQEIETLA